MSYGSDTEKPLQCLSMATELFKCPTPKCAYAIASEGLNAIQLQVLRRWAKTCPRCGQRTKWQEKQTLLKTDTIKKFNGGTKDAKTHKAVPKTASQKRKAARHDGQH